ALHDAWWHLEAVQAPATPTARGCSRREGFSVCRSRLAGRGRPARSKPSPSADPPQPLMRRARYVPGLPVSEPRPGARVAVVMVTHGALLRPTVSSSGRSAGSTNELPIRGWTAGITEHGDCEPFGVSVDSEPGHLGALRNGLVQVNRERPRRPGSQGHTLHKHPGHVPLDGGQHETRWL